MKRIYLDHAASTPVHPEVAQTMMDIMIGQFGNASSVHAFGRASRRTVSEARDVVAASLGCLAEEVIFTSGGTESDGLALFGAAFANRRSRGHIITTVIEHHAVLHSCAELERLGYEVTYVPVDHTGRVHLEEIEAAIRPDTFLISMMYANNEVGTVQPVIEVGELAHSRGILFHVDAVQAFGALSMSVRALPVDMLSVSGHKINGPQGIGALYVRRGIALHPRQYGGLQEKRRRAGTENVAGIAGFAKAAAISSAAVHERSKHDLLMRQTLLGHLAQRFGSDGFTLNGSREYFLPHIMNLSFPGCSTETMLMNLDIEGIAAASGSACTSGSIERSHVLKAMNLPEKILCSAIRFSFGLGNTMEEMEKTAEKVATISQRMRNRK